MGTRAQLNHVGPKRHMPAVCIALEYGSYRCHGPANQTFLSNVTVLRHMAPVCIALAYGSYRCHRLPNQTSSSNVTVLRHMVPITSRYCILLIRRGGGLGSRPKKMYGERLGDGVEYHLMSPTPRREVPFTTQRRTH